MQLIVLCLLLIFASHLQAIEYDIFIVIQSESEIYDLRDQNDISDDQLNALIELYQQGLDLNAAPRDALWELPNLSHLEVDAIIALRETTSIIDPAILVSSGVLSKRKWQAILPFLVLYKAKQQSTKLKTSLRAQSVWIVATGDPPPVAVRGKIDHRKFSMGFASVLTHNRLANITSAAERENNQRVLSAQAAQTKVQLAKYYFLYKNRAHSAIVGHYRIGFGQRLTFSNSYRHNPNGFYANDSVLLTKKSTLRCKESAAYRDIAAPCAGNARYQYTMRDYSWNDDLRGAALGLNKIQTGNGWIQTYVFTSLSDRSIYQYDIYDRKACRRDPAQCAIAPKVLKQNHLGQQGDTRFSYQTLPKLYREILLGANLSYFWNSRVQLGLTGYRADIDWLVKDMQLDFQDSSRYPAGGRFGAIGVDTRWENDRLDIALEISHSFDSAPRSRTESGGRSGGLGAILQATTFLNRQNGFNSELEASLRYYGRDFANPYARPIASADEYAGLRARNEVGAMIKFSGKTPQLLEMRSSANFWTNPSEQSTAKLRLDLQTAYLGWRHWQPEIFVAFYNNAIALNDTPCVQNQNSKATLSRHQLLCNSRTSKTAGRLLWRKYAGFSISSQLQIQWNETPQNAYKDLSAWLKLSARPTSKLQLLSRLRYLYRNVCLFTDPAPTVGAARSYQDCLRDLFTGSNNDQLERTLRWGMALTNQYTATTRLRIGYEFIQLLDDRTSSKVREPSPEHWILVEIETNF